MLDIVILVAVGVAVSVSGCLLAVRHWRTPRELRGDWWRAFERDFHAYAAGLSESGPSRRRRQQSS